MPTKVFELAKELNKGPLDLVEELKGHGFTVKNHMATLSDEEVQRIRGIFAPKSTSSSDVVKKTTTRKKVVKKEENVASPASPSSLSVSSTTELEDEKKKTVIRRKTKDEKSDLSFDVATNFADDHEQRHSLEDFSTEEKEPVFEAEEVLEVPLQPVVQEPDIQVVKIKNKPSTTSGLRVVSRPEVKKEPVVETILKKEKDKDKEKDKKVYLEEKIHRFTPVFIPEKKAPQEESAERPRRPLPPSTGPVSATSLPVDTYAEGDDLQGKSRGGSRDDLDSLSGKKRLGGLASMMSGKKIVAAVSRSQVLNEVKAEDELKIYSALSSIGKPVYTTIKKKKTYHGPSQSTLITEVKDSKRVVGIHKVCRASDLADKLTIKFEDFADKALELNLLLRAEDFLGFQLCQELAALYQYRVEDKSFNEEKVLAKETLSEEQISKLPLRAPIITIMGHVDHGKTSLLDYIRKAKVAAGEAGGITQHIGAYSVNVNNKTLTFLDTPGHAAFANMRQRGANITDIVVLVVACDDGVMPQTKESIIFCKEAKVPIIVAVNKMDKEGATPDRIKTQLTEFNITPEEWGGETQFVSISALTGMGIDNLLEAIALQAEVMELRADHKGPAEGVVIESKIEQGRGPVATILVQKGTLRQGDSIVVGECYGRARSLVSSLGENLKEAGPSVPVQILGLDGVPNPGEILNAVKNEREAKKIVDNRLEERKKASLSVEKKKMSLEDFFGTAKNSDKEKVLNLIIRTDVQGSFEAIKQSIEALSNSEVLVKVLSGGVGAITDSDVQMASSCNAYIVGFNMRPVTTARRMAEDRGVDIKNYSVIYELINDVKLAMEGLLEPEYNEEFIGRAEVRETFDIPKVGMIAGSIVVDGKIAQGCKIRLLRNGKIVHDGKLSSLKRFKDDVKEVKNGVECGIALENFTDVKVGDIFEAYLLIQKKRTLEDVAKSGPVTSAQTESRA